jgi:transposase
LERRVRATTAFNKMLAIPGANVVGVQFTPTGIVVALRRRSRRLRCPCGWSTHARAPQARVCADPFHVVKLANHALDEVRRAAWNRTRRATGIARRPSGRIRTNPAADLVKHTRWALLKDPAALTDQQQATLDRLRRSRHVLFRAWALKEELRDLYRLPEGHRADAHLDAWLARACRCRIPAMVALSKTIRTHRQQILAAVQLGLSNSKLEGLNSKIRLINHRGYGHHSAAAVIAMIYLCCSGLTITLPTGR